MRRRIRRKKVKDKEEEKDEIEDGDNSDAEDGDNSDAMDVRHFRQIRKKDERTGTRSPHF